MAGLMDTLGKPELWQWLGGVGGGMSRAARGQGFDISGANQQLFGAMAARKKGTEFEAMLHQLPPGTLNKAQHDALEQMEPAMRAPVFAKYMLSEGKGPAVWEQKMRQMVKMGTSPEIASGLSTGRLAWKTDPVEGTTTLMDVRTQQPYGSGDTTAAPTPTSTPVDDGTPAAAADYRGAFGFKGQWNHFWNTAFDYLGLAQPSPEAATARRQFENINAQTATLLAEGVDTRGGKYLLDRFDEIQAKAGGIQGPEDALKTLKEMKGLLQRSHDVHQGVIGSRVTPREKSDATAGMRRLEPLIAEYEKIIRMFESQEAQLGAGGGTEEAFDLQNEQPWDDEIEALIRKHTDG